MKILISNDDGIDSPGIQALAKAVQRLGEVYVVAPHRERSTASHSLTLHKPVRIFSLGENQYATTGTPADCIYLGIREILKGKPDMILSGINAGANLGTDIHYSGTVAAAREGALMNIPSYAFSMVDIHRSRAFQFEMAAEIAALLLEKNRTLTFPSHSLINVNIPNIDKKEIRGFRVSNQGFRFYAHEVLKRTDPRGKDYYWIGGPYVGFEKSDVSDCHAVEEGFVSVTPLTLDCTQARFKEQLDMAGVNQIKL
jgi:5'-nucleotidase